METIKSEKFNFDEWSQLAKRDPDAFEARRRLLIEQVIQHATDANRARLRGLQFRLDMERRRSRTPLGACLRISDMMWHAMLGPGGLQVSLAHLVGIMAGKPCNPPAKTQPATACLIHFPDRVHPAS